MEVHQFRNLLQEILVELKDMVDLDSMVNLSEGIVALKDNIDSWWFIVHKCWIIKLYLRLWMLCLM